MNEGCCVFQNGANTKQKDYDGLEPLSLLGDQLMTLKKEQGTRLHCTFGSNSLSFPLLYSCS